MWPKTSRVASLLGAFWCLCLLSTLPAAADDSSPRRLAFVVGIGDYENITKLPRAVRDAEDVASKLADLGFDIVGGVGKDLTRDEFRAKWDAFVAQVKPRRNDTVVVFFAGHGVEIEGNGYIQARNAPFKRAGRQNDLIAGSHSLKDMMLDLQARQPRLVLMIIDACRTNPFVPPEYSVKGIGGVSNTGDGILVVFSAGGNEIALERLPPPDNNPNSVFARELLPMLGQLKTVEMPLYMEWSQALQRNVRKTSGEKQFPRVYNGVQDNFCLLCGDKKRAPLAWTTLTRTNDQVWADLKTTTNENELQTFIALNRTSEYAKLASQRLDNLIRAKSTLHIVSIGVTEVRGSNLPPLRYPSLDAQAIPEAFKANTAALYGRVTTRVLASQSATRAAILAAFDAVREAARPEDTVVVYLTGHAVESNGEAYYVPSDGRGDDARTYIKLEEIQRKLMDTSGRRILLIDTCGVTLTDALARSLIDRPRNDQMTVLAAAGPGGMAFESERLRGGVFTYAVKEALQGKAFVPSQMDLTLLDFGTYVTREVERLTQGRQIPYFRTDDLQFVIARNASPVLIAKRYDDGASDTEIKIGNTNPYSGPASAYGQIGKATEAYFKMVNDEGGINGRKITFITYDDGYAPPKIVETMRKLIVEDKVLLVFQTLGIPNTAMLRYMNGKKVPQLFVATGSSIYGNPREFPWTMGWQPDYITVGVINAKHILANVKDAKIAVLMQNDDYGRGYFNGFKQGLGKDTDKIVQVATYDVDDPTVDSQIIALKNSGANVFFNITTPKFAVQAIKKAAEIGWKPAHYLNNVSSSVGAVIKPAGYENAQGILTAAYLKDPADPQWANSPDMIAWNEFMDKYYPGGDKKSVFPAYAYAVSSTLVEVLKRAGDNLTRANIIKEAASLKGLEVPLLLPGITVNTGPNDYFPIQSMRLQRFKGETWELVGDVLSNEAVSQ